MPRRKAVVGPLGSHEGYPVTLLSIAYRQGGDGLSKSLAIDPQPTETGTVNYWLVKTITGPTDYNPLDSKGKRVKPGELLEDGFSSYERVEDQPILRVVRFPAEEAEALFDQLEERIATMEADAERAERAARGEVDMGPAAGGEHVDPVDA